MPTTLVGVILFVVLMLPGFAYLVGKERVGTERRTSPFRETVAIAAASVTSELAVFGLFAVVRAVRPDLTPNVGQLIQHPETYAPVHYEELIGWGVGLLLAAVALARAATWPRLRNSVVVRRLFGAYPHESTVSAWWILFRQWAPGTKVSVGCHLDDGSYVSGKLETFNTLADDSQDRDLIIRGPVQFRPDNKSELEELDCGAVSIPGRRIVLMTVRHYRVKRPPSLRVRSQERWKNIKLLRRASAARPSALQSSNSTEVSVDEPAGGGMNPGSPS
ncbi:DUF6338 family protein [Microbispora sp. H10830]|uniref:DUF6338 family protein n=1 Tax=Microbispora sp. H10830 TaxID=2729109 RepID=UPI001C71C12F